MEEALLDHVVDRVLRNALCARDGMRLRLVTEDQGFERLRIGGERSAHERSVGTEEGDARLHGLLLSASQETHEAATRSDGMIPIDPATWLVPARSMSASKERREGHIDLGRWRVKAGVFVVAFGFRRFSRASVFTTSLRRRGATEKVFDGSDLQTTLTEPYSVLNAGVSGKRKNEVDLSD